jgi:hypothetical protein
MTPRKELDLLLRVVSQLAQKQLETGGRMQGRFRFSAPPKKILYHLQFGRSGFNWVRIILKLEKKAGPVIAVKMPLGT